MPASQLLVCIRHHVQPRCCLALVRQFGEVCVGRGVPCVPAVRVCVRLVQPIPNNNRRSSSNMMLRLLALVLALLAAVAEAFVVPCPGQAAVRTPAAQRQQSKGLVGPTTGRSSRQGLVK